MRMPRHALEHGHVYPIADAGHSRADQRAHSGGGGGGSAEILRYLAAVLERMPARQPLAVHRAGHGEQRQLVVIPQAIGACLPERCHGRHHDGGRARRNPFVADSQPLGVSGRHAFDDDVASDGELEQNLAPALRL